VSLSLANDAASLPVAYRLYLPKAWAASLEASARDTGAFLRARVIESAVDLLRMILAYCLGGSGLRCTAAWANAVGLADISNVALLYRLRQCGDWLALLLASRWLLMHLRQLKAG
jgi:hypothetical protein